MAFALAIPAGTAVATTGSTGRVAQLSTTDFTTRLLSLINARRHKVGCPAVKANAALTRSARTHDGLMVAARNFTHQLPHEASLAPRIVRAGYANWTALAENLAIGTGTPAGIFSIWMASTLHRQNIQRCTYRDAGIGVGYVGGQPWVTLDLGRHR
jgi:uncharacterized protein YkwD